MGVVLKADSLDKGFLRKKALDNLNLEIEEGKIYGLFGPNGSGKTTFMKIAAGFLRHSKGEILVNGSKPSAKSKDFIAFMPTFNYFYKWMKVKDSLKFFQDMYSDFDPNKAYELLEDMKIDLNDKIASLSTGMLGRLKLSLTLSRRAKIYLLDEPLNGIDPVSREKIVEAVIGEYGEGNTIIISSHLVKEFEAIIDEVIFLSKGKVVLKGNAEALRIEKGISINELYKEVFAND